MLEKLFVAFESCVNSTAEYIRTLLQEKCATGQIPTELIREIARCLLPDVIAYCKSEEGKAKFAKWKAEQDAKKKGQSKAT